MRHRLPSIASGIVLVYGLIPVLLSSFDLSGYASTQIGFVLSILFYPWLYFMFWVGSIFHVVGLPTQGDWAFMLPTPVGMVALVILIAGVVYAMVWVMTTIFYRGR